MFCTINITCENHYMYLKLFGRPNQIKCFGTVDQTGEDALGTYWYSSKPSGRRRFGGRRYESTCKHFMSKCSGPSFHVPQELLARYEIL